MTARFSVTSNGSWLPRMTVMRIEEPISPRIFSTASFRVRPMIGWPSSAEMKSPGCRPASAAGVPSIGETTLIRPSSIVTSMPRPPNSPLVWTCMSPKSFWFR